MTHPDGSLSTTTASLDDEDNKQPGLCCLQGCLAGTAVGASFFIALPTGIVLVFLGINRDDTALQIAGGVLIALPLIVLIIVIILCLNQNRLPCVLCFQKKKKIVTASAPKDIVTLEMGQTNQGFNSWSNNNNSRSINTGSHHTKSCNSSNSSNSFRKLYTTSVTPVAADDDTTTKSTDLPETLNQITTDKRDQTSSIL